MQKNPLIRILSIVLAFALIFALLPPIRSSAEPAKNCNAESVLRVGTPALYGSFSPFYASTSYDQEIVDMVSLNLLTYDRAGYIIQNSIEGETVSYDGTDYTYTGPADLSVDYREAQDVTVYTARLREDLKFWDGEPVTAKDLMFTYYTLLDGSYYGSYYLDSYDIQGVNNWRTQTTDAVYAKYDAMAARILEDGRGSGYVQNSVYTREIYNAYWGWIDEQWAYTIQCIYDYIIENYLNDNFEYYAEDRVGKTIDEIRNNEGLKVAYSMAMWGFARINSDTGLFTDLVTGERTWNLRTSFPTLNDFFDVTKLAYNDDPVSFYNMEQTGNEGMSIEEYARHMLISTYGPMDPAMGGQGITSISGIKMLDDYTVEITVNGFAASAVYTVLGIPITPMHYYGDPAKWDPANGKYGFERGNLEKVMELTDVPRGAGPYVFDSYEGEEVTLSANPNWYKGAPFIDTVAFRETDPADLPDAIANGEIDVGETTGSSYRFDQIAELNPNGELTGDVITTFRVNNLGYGYIGLNADTINVNDDPDSNASKALRKALATVLAVYREDSYGQYYGDAAKVIEYPISDSSWAAPRPNDTGYRTAFSKDANGNDIYTPGMTQEQRYAAAKAAALTWFQAAGYTVNNGKVTKAPNGAKLSFEVIVPGSGEGNHPSYRLLAVAKTTLAEIGITLNINDPDNSSVIWDALDDGTQELWCAAWGSTIDPDLYQIYHSNNIVGLGGMDSNHYHIRDDELDELILDARRSDDQSYRREIYRQCLDIIMDWGVEIPAYQRQNAILFSTERVDMDTLTPDISTFWGWQYEIERLRLKGSHLWDEGTTTEPSCTEDGLIVYTCTLCGETKTQTIPALGHAFEWGVCTRCGYEAQHASEIFDDVADGKYYAKHVLWAVKHEITAGTDEGTFSPNNTCTRAQVMTFLWKAFGSHEPSVTDNPFSDVKTGRWYTTAILWAYHNTPQITSGDSESTFGINNGCTRAQVVTFLWKAAGAPEPETAQSPFTDVTPSKWYYKAVLWAVENGITSGVGDGLFGTNQTCTRAQVVSFLHLAIGD